MRNKIECAGLAIDVDENGAWNQVRLGRAEVAFPGIAPRFFLAGKLAVVRSVSRVDGGLALALAGDGCAGVFRMEPSGDAIRCALEVEGGEPYDLVRVELPLPTPPASTLHVPTAYTFGHAVDEAGPTGRQNGIPCRNRRWQFLGAELAGGVLSLIGHSDLERIPRGSFGCPWKAGGFVDEDALWVQVESLTGARWELAVDGSLDAAVDRYHEHLRSDYGAVPWRGDPNLPEWFADVKMVVTLDMLRSHGDVAHTYAQVRDLCREMKAAGIGGGVLFYVPGYHDRYDAGYPLYAPYEVLGGPRGFSEMVEAVHDAGHRVMCHVCLWGADPYQLFFDEVEGLAVPWNETENIPSGRLDRYAGWPGCMPVTPLDYDSGDLPLDADVREGRASFQTPDVPQPMEAFLTISRIRNFGSGRLRILLHDRQVLSRPGEFAGGDSCRFRFRLRFAPGVNYARLEFLGGAPDLSSATFRIGDAVHSERTWTHPFVRMDITHPRWIGMVRDEVVDLVRSYHVDAVHCDAGNIATRREAPIYQALRDALPGTLFGCEYLCELGCSVFHIMQNGSIPEEGPHRVTDLGWRLVEPYLKLYYHLCRSPAFVPVGTVCNHRPVPSALTQEEQGQAERLWREGPEWHILPNLRLNYRDYGLDPRTRSALTQVLGGRARGSSNAEGS